MDGKLNNKPVFGVGPRDKEGRSLVVVKFHNEEIFRDELNVNRADLRGRFFKRLSAILHDLTGTNGEYSANRLMATWGATLTRLADEAEAKAAQEAEAEKQTPTTWKPDAKAKEKAAELLERDDLLTIITDTVNELGIVGERPLIALTYLTATSRLLEKPLYLLLKGESGSGKTAIARTVCDLLPPELVVDATELTTNALYYLNTIDIRHKVLLLGERKRQTSDESIDSTKAIRELTETGKLTKLLPIKQPDGRFVTKSIELVGPTALIETCSHDSIAHEDQTRQIETWTDGSPQQTQEVITTTAEKEAGNRPKPDQSLIDAIRAIQVLLEPMKVKIPFLGELVEEFPCDKVEARRAFKHLAAVAKASAILHQRQREHEDGAVVAIPDDLKLAIRLLQPWLDVTLGGGVSPTVATVWEAVRQRKDMFTAADLVTTVNRNRKVISRALRTLANLDVLRIVGERINGKKLYFTVADPNWQPGALDNLLTCLSKADLNTGTKFTGIDFSRLFGPQGPATPPESAEKVKLPDNAIKRVEHPPIPESVTPPVHQLIKIMWEGDYGPRSEPLQSNGTGENTNVATNSRPQGA